MVCEQIAQNEVLSEELFFDSKEEISPLFDSCPSSPSRPESESSSDPISPYWVSDAWAQNPLTIQERREKFTKLVGLDLTLNSKNDIQIKTEEETETENEISSVSSSISPSPCSSSTSTTSSSNISSDGISEENQNLQCRIRNLDTGTTFLASETGTDGTVTSLTEMGSNKRVSLPEFEKSFSSSSFIKSLMRRQNEEPKSPNPQIKPTLKNSIKLKDLGWLKKLGVSTCIMDRELKTKTEQKTEEVNTPSSSESDQSFGGANSKRVKVKVNKKKSKELSAIFEGQSVKAHDSAISAVKFSPDGNFLATGGKDGLVKIWRVLIEDNCEGLIGDDLEFDFRVDDNCELAPVSPKIEEKGKNGNSNNNKACVVIPRNIFRIFEEPLHEFKGHNGEVLDLDWDNNLRILSSSTDKTVRLWQVGKENCIKIFQHKNFVTCVQFNPQNSDNFISGSIDNKIRVWGIKKCQVIDWIDVRDIITTICYTPDAKEVVVGTINGNCRFYGTSDKNLQLENDVSLNGKKKSTLKRITGFQFCPNDSKKLMVTSADSKIRILDGIEIICKYKGIKNSSTNPAKFTKDGRHLIISDEDSNIYLFNHSNPDPLSHFKSTNSHERFSSPNSSIALPWTNHTSPPHQQLSGCTSSSSSAPPHGELYSVPRHRGVSGCTNSPSRVEYRSPSGSFSLGEEFLTVRGTATWPEEKLPGGGTMSKAQVRVLKAACMNSEHMWGQVVLTAGYDGVIRVFQNYGLPINV